MENEAHPQAAANGEEAPPAAVVQEMTAVDLSSPPRSPPRRQSTEPFITRYVVELLTRREALRM